MSFLHLEISAKTIINMLIIATINSLASNPKFKSVPSVSTHGLNSNIFEIIIFVSLNVFALKNIQAKLTRVNVIAILINL